MIHAKNKGTAFELAIAKKLRLLGFEAITSRSESKNLDDRGCDIITDAPYSIQCKAAESLKLSTHVMLAGMKEKSLERPVIVHKKNHQGITVTMQWQEFEEILKAIKN